MDQLSPQKLFRTIKENRSLLLLFCAAAWSGYSLVFLFSDAQVYAPLGLLLSPVLLGFFRLHLRDRQTLRTGERILCLALACGSACALYLSADVSGRFDAAVSSLGAFAVRAFCIAGTAVLLYALFCAFCGLCLRKTKQRPAKPFTRRGFVILWAVFFGVWFALYLVCFYPGLFSPDTAGQLYMVEGTRAWDNHHPVLHTVILYFTMRLTGFRPVFYVFFQTLVMSALMAYTCVWVRNRRISEWVWCGVFLYFLLHPIFAVNTFSFIKDTLFSGAILFFTLHIADAILTPEQTRNASYLFRLTVSALLVLFLRNNGFFVVLLTFAALVIFLRGQRLRMALVGGGSFVFFCFVQFVAFPILGVAQTSTAESLGIPLQMLCSVIAAGKTYSADIMQYLNRILPLETMAEVFDPQVVDPIKFDEAFNIAVIDGDLPRFLLVWARGLLQHPLEYVKAYLCITRFLWDPMQKAGMIESVYSSPYFTFFTPRPLIPALSSVYYAVINLSQNSRYAFFTRPFWNTAVTYLVSALCATATLRKTHAKQLLIWIPAFAVWASLMISTPIATCGRYALSAFLCLPVFVCLAVSQAPQREA